MPLLARGRLGRGWTTARANALAFNVYYDYYTQQFSHSRVATRGTMVSGEVEYSSFEKRARRFERPHFPRRFGRFERATP